MIICSMKMYLLLKMGIFQLVMLVFGKFKLGDYLTHIEV